MVNERRTAGRVEIPALIDRTTRRLVTTGGAAVRRFRGDDARSPLSDRDLRRLRNDIRAAVSAESSEMAARAKAAEIGNRYLEMDIEARTQFFSVLAEDFGLDRSVLNAAIATHQRVAAAEGPDDTALFDAQDRLREALIPPRVRLMTRFNGIEHGVKFLVDLRADLRDLGMREPNWRAMDDELRRLLGSWFDLGLLELRQISWETSAALLERLIRYESVHAIESWTDLKNRLDSDRRCYAFFHPGMPDEPLIFVEVALVHGIADDVVDLLDESKPTADPLAADTAIFYSISNCQRGLAGVNLGDSLIKRVVADLVRDLPNLSRFATLSPIPGFRAWLDQALERPGVVEISEDEAARLTALLPGIAAPEAIQRLLADGGWPDRPEVATALRGPLMRACSRYLISERHRGRALDRVANFHLTNGARVEQLNWLGNRSPVGLERSAGIMVNYRYLPDEIERNHLRYVTRSEVVSSAGVRRLAEA